MSLFFILSFNLNQSVPVESTATIDSKSIKISKAAVPGVTIVMMDEVLYVNVDNPSDLLEEVELFNSSNVSVLRAENCNSTEWSVDLSALSSGDYDVEVLTTLANKFNTTITIN